jgi:hypothetical protein
MMGEHGVMEETVDTVKELVLEVGKKMACLV